MDRTITVKGYGHASVRPDLIVVSMTLETRITAKRWNLPQERSNC